MSRKPAITSLLNGQAVKIRFGSISVTSSPGLIRLSARAQPAPPKPPPITTTRAADRAIAGQGSVSDAADAAMPRTTFLRVRRNAFMSIFPEVERRPKRPPPRVSGARVSGEGDVLVAQRHRANSFSRCREIGVQYRRSGDADGRLADPAPEAAARHHDRFHLRHLADPHRIVGVEVGLLDAAVLHRAAAIEQPGQAVDEGARDLALDLRRVDGVAGVGGGDDAMHLDLAAVDDGDFRRA